MTEAQILVSKRKFISPGGRLASDVYSGRHLAAWKVRTRSNIFAAGRAGKLSDRGIGGYQA